MNTTIFITTQFEGFHRWKDAPEKFGYLRHWHRHMFHVKVWMEVNGNNRQIEFIDFKSQVDKHIRETYFNKKGDPVPFEWSCEQIAEQLLETFGASCVEVSEDGENGAFVQVTEDVGY